MTAPGRKFTARASDQYLTPTLLSSDFFSGICTPSGLMPFFCIVIEANNYASGAAVG